MTQDDILPYLIIAGALFAIYFRFKIKDKFGL
jgi:hypothetical protein